MSCICQLAMRRIKYIYLKYIWQLLHWECQESTTEVWPVATVNYKSDYYWWRHYYGDITIRYVTRVRFQACNYIWCWDREGVYPLTLCSMQVAYILMTSVKAKNEQKKRGLESSHLSENLNWWSNWTPPVENVYCSVSFFPGIFMVKSRFYQYLNCILKTLQIHKKDIWWLLGWSICSNTCSQNWKSSKMYKSGPRTNYKSLCNHEMWKTKIQIGGYKRCTTTEWIDFQ